MTQSRLLLMVLLAILLLGGCAARQQEIKTVPIHETTKVEIGSIEMPADSIAIRVPIESILNREQSGGVAVSAEGLQLLWELKKGMISIKAYHPPEQVSYPITTITKEIPVEVEVAKEVKIHSLHWWQSTLMWIGVLALITITISITVKLKNR